MLNFNFYAQQKRTVEWASHDQAMNTRIFMACTSK